MIPLCSLDVSRCQAAQSLGRPSQCCTAAIPRLAVRLRYCVYRVQAVAARFGHLLHVVSDDAEEGQMLLHSATLHLDDINDLALLSVPSRVLLDHLCKMRITAAPMTGNDHEIVNRVGNRADNCFLMSVSVLTRSRNCAA